MSFQYDGVRLIGADEVPVDERASFVVATAGIGVTSDGVILQIQGSASKIIRVRRLLLSGVKTAAGNALVLLQKHGATATGANAPVTPSKLDSVSAAASATCLSYSAGGTVSGTLLGNILAQDFRIGDASNKSDVLDLHFGATMRPITLRGTSEYLVLYMSTSAWAGASIKWAAFFTEE